MGKCQIDVPTIHHQPVTHSDLSVTKSCHGFSSLTVVKDHPAYLDASELQPKKAIPQMAKL